MTSDETIYDSPTGWVKRHIDEYVASDGAKGKEWRGTETLLLTTRGRKSGKLRRSALIYTEDGPNYVLVASQGGAPQHPAWYLNLTANPEVSIQVGPRHHLGIARTATGQERARLWDQMNTVWPAYEDYQKKTDREIPVVIVEVAEDAG
jgi:deazaflavin-dependent oxidoreductase (nitroreductase family)